MVTDMLDGSHPSTPASSPTAGGGIAAAICAALGEPVRIVEINDGDGRLIMAEPLHFHRVVRRSGRDVVSKFHVERDTYV